MLISKTTPAIALLLAVLGAQALAADAQLPARTESSWKPLVNEPSRAQLFKRFAPEMASRVPSVPFVPFALPSPFKFPHDSQFDTNGAARQNEIFGVDISHYQGTSFPFSALSGVNVSFIYIKATQGTDTKDSLFAHNWTTAGSLPANQKIPRGAYHFLSSDPSMSGKAQADSFVDYVNLHGGFQAGDLPPAVDLEWDVACSTCPDRWTTHHRTTADIIATTQDFAAEVKQKTGRTPMLYTNKSFLKDHQITSAGQIGQITAGYKVWIFDIDSHDRAVELPDPTNNLDHVIWQFSFNAAIGTVFSGGVDADVFKGTPDAFKAAMSDPN